MEPRHFWRRLFALIIDYFLASAVALALVWLFLGNTDRIRLGGAFELSSEQCGAVQSVPQELLDVFDIFAPLRPDRVEVCETWAWGVPNGLTATLENVEVSDRGVTTERRVVVAISEEGMPVNPVYPQGPLAAALFLVGSALALSRSGTTPGKWLMGLCLSEVPALGRALRREAWRFAPFLAFYGLGLAVLLLGVDFAGWLLAATFSTVAIIWVAGCTLFLWYYLPILRWRGAMRHDAWTGLAVVRR